MGNEINENAEVLNDGTIIVKNIKETEDLRRMLNELSQDHDNTK